MDSRVSVIIPTSGTRNEMLKEAVQSVLDQTVNPYEIIVYYDNSMFTQYPQTGTWEKFNQGIRKATGTHFIVLGDDDKLHPQFIEKTTEVCTDIVYTDMQMFGSCNDLIKARPWTKEDIERDTVPWVTSLCSMEVFKKLEGYDPTLQYGDWDFWWRAYEAGFTATPIHEPLFLYRRHQGNFPQDHKFKLEVINKHENNHRSS